LIGKQALGMGCGLKAGEATPGLQLSTSNPRNRSRVRHDGAIKKSVLDAK
jgi:hypothetical protein